MNYDRNDSMRDGRYGNKHLSHTSTYSSEEPEKKTMQRIATDIMVGLKCRFTSGENQYWDNAKSTRERRIDL